MNAAIEKAWVKFLGELPLSGLLYVIATEEERSDDASIIRTRLARKELHYRKELAMAGKN